MILTIPANDAAVRSTGDVDVNFETLLDHIDIRKVISHYGASNLLDAMDWKDIKEYINAVKDAE